MSDATRAHQPHDPLNVALQAIEATGNTDDVRAIVMVIRGGPLPMMGGEDNMVGDHNGVIKDDREHQDCIDELNNRIPNFRGYVACDAQGCKSFLCLGALGERLDGLRYMKAHEVLALSLGWRIFEHTNTGGRSHYCPTHAVVIPPK